MTDLWGSRFSQPLDATMRRFSSSFHVDRRLVMEDLHASDAHAHALRDACVLSEEEFGRLHAALGQIADEVREGRFPPPASGVDDSREIPEDIHSAIEGRLVAICGETGRRLHAGRSRNDQVVTDVLLWLKNASSAVEAAVINVQRALVDRAEVHRDLVIAEYTHLQRAQPVLLAHHLLAHFEALDRDVARLRDARARADRSSLGAAACAGSSLPLDREATARRLGFARVATNSIDAVSDRDWAIEFVSACALVMTHLSRLSAELVLWSTQEFAMARIGDAWCTGSSMMPQKRNPDVAELVRAKAARVDGALVTLLGLVKGLPLAYNRDLQEDKEPLFDAADTTRDAAIVLAAALASTEFREPRAAGADFSAATDLAEELVRRGVAFRDAHDRVGALVRACEERGHGLDGASDAQLDAAGLAGLDRHLLTARGSIEAKRTLGSTAPAEVARALAHARGKLCGT
jgi:argininosuccinate lyase